ncbi:DUF502 domain-containing protein [bacterium]|nr:DUF502 domain-containing protein [bacterium]
MKKALAFAGKACFSGLIIIIPIYLAILLLLKGMKTVVGLVRPFALLLPEWFPAEKFLSLLLVLLICFIIGVLVRTPAGRAAREQIEKSFFERIPGYALLRSLTQQITKDTQETVWKPALAEIEDALVPAFIIEEFEDGRFTVFVPSIPTPFAGAVYILDRKRVHPLDVAFTDALRVVSKWGSGARDLALAMEKSSSTGVIE